MTAALSIKTAAEAQDVQNERSDSRQAPTGEEDSYDVASDEEGYL